MNDIPTHAPPLNSYIQPGTPRPAPSPADARLGLERMAEQLRRAGWTVVPPPEAVQEVDTP
jgi:hypothetical protein